MGVCACVYVCVCVCVLVCVCVGGYSYTILHTFGLSQVAS